MGSYHKENLENSNTWMLWIPRMFASQKRQTTRFVAHMMPQTMRILVASFESMSSQQVPKSIFGNFENDILERSKACQSQQTPRFVANSILHTISKAIGGSEKNIILVVLKKF